MLVLIADDDAVSRKVLERAVTRLGYRTVTASNGEEAWTVFEKEKPDVILSDWMMPKLDGVDLCRRVRANPGAGYPYFVMITSLTAKEDALTGMQAGADDYLRKPVDAYKRAVPPHVCAARLDPSAPRRSFSLLRYLLCSVTRDCGEDALCIFTLCNILCASACG